MTVKTPINISTSLIQTVIVIYSTAFTTIIRVTNFHVDHIITMMFFTTVGALSIVIVTLIIASEITICFSKVAHLVTQCFNLAVSIIFKNKCSYIFFFLCKDTIIEWMPVKVRKRCNTTATHSMSRHRPLNIIVKYPLLFINGVTTRECHINAPFSHFFDKKFLELACNTIHPSSDTLFSFWIAIVDATS